MEKNYYTLTEIAQIIGATLQGDPTCKIYSLASLDKAQAGQLSFLAHSRYQLVATSRYEKFLPTTKASAVLLSPSHARDCPVNKLILDDPHQSYVKLASIFVQKHTPNVGIHPTAIVGQHCHIAKTASIGPYCVIGDHCTIGDQTQIDMHVIINDHAVIGKNGHIHSHVIIHRDVEIGESVLIHAGAVIGGEGFGMIREAEGWKRIPHLGRVLIGDHVEIGAHTTVDRGALDDTLLERGVKLDNQIQVAHGVVIGENTIIAGCVGIGGSSKIGKNCMIGGATGITDNILICDNVILTGMSQVTKSITEPGVYSSGTGILPRKVWHKSIVSLRNLRDIVKKLRKWEENKDE
jgi:UDP-3-O-[3-hydroxymyristoyl] glucosamine N-acyltransferase